MNLLNIRNYAIIALAFALLLQSWRLNSSQQQLATLQNAINHAQTVYKQQTDKLRLREQEAAKRAKQSQKRMDEIMNDVVTGGCQGAIDYLIQKSTSVR
jgi:hypothetical protein